MAMVLRKILTFLCFFAFISGCSSSSSDKKFVPIRVAIWGTPQEANVVKTILKQWSETHPNIKIRIEHTNYGGYVSKILTQIAGGGPPDIICTEVDMFVNYAKKNLFEPLNNYIKNDNKFDIDDFFKPIVDRFTVNGNILSVPRDIAPFACVYYNKDVFDERGVSYPSDDWNWNDLLAKAQALTQTDESGKVKNYGFYCWAWENFVYGNGGSYVDDIENPQKFIFNQEKSIEGLKFYHDMIYKYKVMPPPLFLSNMGMPIHSMFTNGKLAMFSSGIWETPVLREITETFKKQGKSFRWDVVMFPKGNSGRRAFATGGSGYGILRTSRHKKEAWEVLKALCGEEGQKKLAMSGLVQPANKIVAKSRFWAENGLMPENKKMLNDAVSHIVFSPFHSDWMEIKENYIIPQLELAFNGKRSVENVVSQIFSKVEQFFSKK